MRPPGSIAFLAAALLGGTACAPAAPEASRATLAPAPVEIGSFSGEYDPDAGTITIRPGAGPRAGNRASIGEITAVSISNASTPAQGIFCADGRTLALGTSVRITATPFVATNLFTEVYAQIQTLTPATGTEGCNDAALPVGLTDYGLGLWRYPSLGGSNGVTAFWAFKFATGTKSTFTGKIYGTPTTVPPIKVAFITSDWYTGDFGGLAQADLACQTRATEGVAGQTLPAGTYKALLSTDGVNASTRIPEGAYVRPDGTIIAIGLAELFGGTIRAPIQITEFGTVYAPPVEGGAPYAFTGTKTDGTVAPYTCSNWTAAGGSYGNVGNATVTNGLWIDSNGGGMGASGCWAPKDKALYCFQQ